MLTKPSDAEVASVANEMRLLANKLLDVVYEAWLRDERIVPGIAAGALFAAARMIQRQSGITEEDLRRLYDGALVFSRKPAEGAGGKPPCN